MRASVARASVPDAMRAIREAGRAILVAAADGDVPSDAGEHIALFIGNEGAGVRDTVRETADAVVSVRMTGPVESLNAGIAGSILMHELTRE